MTDWWAEASVNDNFIDIKKKVKSYPCYLKPAMMSNMILKNKCDNEEELEQAFKSVVEKKYLVINSIDAIKECYKILY